jgi:hypothetical protein
VSQPDNARGGTTSGTVPAAVGASVTSADAVALSADRTLPTDPAQLEAEIERTRARLVGTVDELATRLQPKEIARRGALDLRARVDHAVRTPEGALRVERIVAVGAAVAALISVVVWNRRRLSRRR